MYVPTLVTHAEKLAFVTRFLNGTQEGFDRSRPLMIVGSGGNGKSKIFSEVVESSPVNILLLNQDYSQKYQVYQARQPTDKVAILILALGTDEEWTLANKLNALVVRFDKDPAFSQPS